LQRRLEGTRVDPTAHVDGIGNELPAMQEVAEILQSDSALLDDVVVTAERRAEPIQKVPTTVTAVSGNEIQALDLGSSAANITFLIADTSAGETAPTRPRWWIRGVGTGAQGFDVQSPVGVYFDDVYFSNVNATGQPVYDQIGEARSTM
jgi:iron complex outermembrane receptor protein